jgi:hypothetical protein
LLPGDHPAPHAVAPAEQACGRIEVARRERGADARTADARGAGRHRVDDLDAEPEARAGVAQERGVGRTAATEVEIVPEISLI